jgi:IS30 family transposase
LVTIPTGKRLTLTWDQGSEMARHDQVALLFGEGVFLADPGSRWMRGTLPREFGKQTDPLMPN